MRPRSIAALALTAAVACAGCASGTSTAGGGGAGATSHAVSFDPRNGAFGCIVGKGFAATKVGTDTIDLGPAAGGAKVVYATTPFAATQDQIHGQAEGAEVIAGAKLFVKNLPERDLSKLESCLDAQGPKY
jgi:hypothetical protein